MGFDPPTAREAGSGVNGCRFLGIPHGYTPGGASHARKHRTSAASALAISAVGAGETESNHVYCRIFRLRLCYLYAFCFPRGEGATYVVRGSDQRSGYPTLVALHVRRRSARIRAFGRRRGIVAIGRGYELLRTGPGVETRVAVGTLEAS